MTLPIFQSDNNPFSLMQTAWAKDINPVISDPTNNNVILKSVSLNTGTNLINHKLGRKLQGWIIVRQRSLANIYDNQDSNSIPQLNLILVSDADVVVDLMCF